MDTKILSVILSLCVLFAGVTVVCVYPQEWYHFSTTKGMLGSVEDYCVHAYLNKGLFLFEVCTVTTAIGVFLHFWRKG